MSKIRWPDDIKKAGEKNSINKGRPNSGLHKADDDCKELNTIH